jgi:hypothetical protein
MEFYQGIEKGKLPSLRSTDNVLNRQGAKEVGSEGQCSETLILLGALGALAVRSQGLGFAFRNIRIQLGVLGALAVRSQGLGSAFRNIRIHLGVLGALAVGPQEISATP